MLMWARGLIGFLLCHCLVFMLQKNDCLTRIGSYQRVGFCQKRNVTWLILPVVICLSQRLSHACVSMNKFRLWNCEWLIKSVIVCLMVSCYSDNRSNSRANTCNKPRLLEGMHLLDKRSTQALLVAAMIHDNLTDRMALVPATHHSNFCPINFRW